MQETIENIEEFLEHKSEDDLKNDKMLYFAVIKNLENLGEAAYMLTPHFKETHPNTPWHSIIGMRHVLVHGYYQIESQQVWRAVRNKFPEFKDKLQKYLS